MSFIDDALVDLYGQDPDRFVARRAELARQARTAGDRDAATAVAALRRPTFAASLVNRHALADPTVAARCTELGDRLRDAQRRLDADLLRQLGARRRALVVELTDAALAGTSRPVSRTAREDVHSTYDAAVADPRVSATLGRLTAAEHWSGFGPAPAAPSLTLVAGGAAAPATRRAHRPGSASRGRTERAEPVPDRPASESLSVEPDGASASELTTARSEERAAAAEVARLTRARAELDHRIAAAEAALADARAARARAAGESPDALSGAPSDTPAD